LKGLPQLPDVRLGEVLRRMEGGPALALEKLELAFHRLLKGPPPDLLKEGTVLKLPPEPPNVRFESPRRARLSASKRRTG